jgi:hypothetical protein
MIRLSRPGNRGERVVTIVGRDAMDATAALRRGASESRTANACGPGALVAGAKLADDESAGDGDTKAGLAGARTT